MQTFVRSRRGSVVLAFALCALVLSGCTTTTTAIPLNDRSYGIYARSELGNVPYEELRPIQATRRDFVWQSCYTMATGLARDMTAAFARDGANALTDVTWTAIGHSGGSPRCRTEWGWMASAAGLGLLVNPIFLWLAFVQGRTLGAEGVLIRVDDPAALPE